MLVLSMWLDDIFNKPADVAIYFVMGAVGTTLLILRLVLMIWIGADTDGDFDVDVDVDGGGGLEAHGGDFSFFSMLSVLSFMAGAGWMGVACRTEWGMGPALSAGCSAAFGFLLLMIASGGMYLMRKLNEAGCYDVTHCVGRIGRVYRRIPAKGEGFGEVQITVDGRQKVLSAVSTDVEIDSFAAAKVVGVQEGETLIVEPV